MFIVYNLLSHILVLFTYNLLMNHDVLYISVLSSPIIYQFRFVSYRPNAKQIKTLLTNTYNIHNNARYILFSLEPT